LSGVNSFNLTTQFWSSEQMKTGILNLSRRKRLFLRLISLLLVAGVARQVRAVNTTTVQDVVYRAELKTDMRWLVGNGSPGRLQELEARVEHHEAILQRALGIGAAAGVLLTLVHLGIDYLRLHLR